MSETGIYHFRHKQDPELELLKMKQKKLKGLMRMCKGEMKKALKNKMTKYYFICKKKLKWVIRLYRKHC